MDNNVNQVTQQLLTLGHQKKDKPTPLTPRRSLLSPTPSVVEKEPVLEEEEIVTVKKLPSLAEMQMSNQISPSSYNKNIKTERITTFIITLFVLLT